jgi:hypothetical protein
MSAAQKYVPLIVLLLSGAWHPVVSAASAAAQPGVTHPTESSRNETVFRSIKNQLEVLLRESRPAYWPEPGQRDSTVKGRAALSGLLSKLDSEGASLSYLVHAEYYLTSMPPADDFSHVLWRFLSHVEWVERTRPKGPIFDKLVRLAKQIPANDLNLYECRFTFVAHHLHHGRAREALAILQELEKDDQLPVEFSPMLVFRTGLAREGLGDWQHAAEAYALLTEDSNHTDTPAGLSASIRLLFLHLRDRRFKEAKSVLDGLSQANTHTLAQLPGGGQLAAMLVSKQLGELDRVWQAADRWRPLFDSLLEELGFPEVADSGAVPLPVIENRDAFLRRLDTLAESPDPEGFAEGLRTAAAAACWDPASFNNFIRTVLFGTPAIAPRHTAHIRNFVIDACSHFRFGRPQDRYATALYQCLALLQTEKDREALEVAEKECKAMAQAPEDPLGQTLLRLWAAAVRRTDGDVTAAGRALENLLESSIRVTDRLATVDALARLYRHIGEPEAEEGLLQRELAKPLYKGNREALDKLAERYKQSKRLSEEGRRLTRTTARWIQNKAPRWIRFARPFSIEEMANRELIELIENPTPTFSFLEGAKLRLLASKDSSLPVDERVRAFQGAIETIAASAQDLDFLQKLCGELAADTSLTTLQRTYFAWLAIANAAYADHKPIIRKLLVSPLLDNPGVVIADAMAGVEHLLLCNRMDKESLQLTVERLSEGEVRAFDLLVIDVLVTRLLDLGAIEEMRHIQAAVPRWQITEEAGRNRVEISLDMGQKIKRCQRRIERNRRLGDITLTIFPEIGSERPDFFHRIEPNAGVPNWLTDAQVRELLLYKIRQGLHHNWSYTTWLELSEQIPHPTPDEMLDRKFAIIAELLASLDKDDVERAGVISDLAGLFDIDSPPERERVKRLIAPYGSDARTAPASAFAVAAYSALCELRDGQDVDWEAVFSGIEHPGLVTYRLRHQLEKGIKAQDNTLLVETLSEVQTIENLSDSVLLPLVCEAHEIVEGVIPSELGLQLKRVRDMLLVYATATGDVSALYQTLHATRILGDIRTLPNGWFEEFSQRCRRARQLIMSEAHLAEQLEDWSRLGKLSEQGITEYPTYYDFYRFHGLAMAEQGKTERAIRSLQTYCRFSKNELEYPAALALLEKLEADTSQGD